MFVSQLVALGSKMCNIVVNQELVFVMMNYEVVGHSFLSVHSCHHFEVFFP